MPFHETGVGRYYSFQSFDEAGVINAAITRRGGVSPAPWDSLNVGATVGDDAARVAENRRRAFQLLGREPHSLYDVWQVHGDAVVCAHAPRPPDQPHQRADAILTDQPGVTLFMRFADCAPIFLYDPHRKVIGLVHAGWQGVVRKTAAAAVAAMQAQYGSRPADILAGIGPSIAAHHYPVGKQVIEAAQQAFGAEAKAFFSSPNGDQPSETLHFDMWEANRFILQRAGVRQIEVSGLCTACSLEDWYSHRAEKGHTGRFGALLGL